MADQARPGLSDQGRERLSGDPGLRPVNPRAAKRAQLARAARAWGEIEALHEQTVDPDPAYARAGASQYPEGVVAVSGGPEVDDNFEDALNQAGLPPVGGAGAQPSTDPRSNP